MNKNQLTFIFGFLISFNVLANPEKDIDKQIKKIIQCAGKILKHKRGGMKGFRYVREQLYQVRENKNDLSKLEALNQACKDERNKLPKDKSLTVDELMREAKIILETEDYNLGTVLIGLIDPILLCKTGSISGSAAAILAVGGGIGGGICQSSNGKKYVALQLNLNGGFGLGAFVQYASTNDETRHIDSPATIKTRSILDIALIVSYATGLEETKELESNYTGRGLGIGVARQWQVSTSLKLIPLPGDYSELIELVKN